MRKILIVDDSPTIATVFSRFLTKAGYEVSTAGDGQGGLASARRERPELILLDNVLPDVHGTEICRALKADAELAGIKVLLLTGTADASLQEAGADLVMTKDCGPARVMAAVAELLEPGTVR
jgi:DNA-binding response OmpR family regulator